jgi:large subunit ribosomal protein L22
LEIVKMEAKAQKKYIRSSPRKMRLVIDMIRGKSAETALSILQFAPKHAAQDALMVLKSAISNLSNVEEGFTPNNQKVIVKSVWVNEGPMVKRIQPAPMGRAYRVRKRSNHLTIVVETQE